MFFFQSDSEELQWPSTGSPLRWIKINGDGAPTRHLYSLATALLKSLLSRSGLFKQGVRAKPLDRGGAEGLEKGQPVRLAETRGEVFLSSFPPSKGKILEK